MASCPVAQPAGQRTEHEKACELSRQFGLIAGDDIGIRMALGAVPAGVAARALARDALVAPAL